MWIGLLAGLAALKIPNPLMTNAYFRPVFFNSEFGIVCINDGNDIRAAPMTMMRRTSCLKSYLLVFFAAVILLGLNLLVIIWIMTPISLPGYFSNMIFIILTSPTIIIWLYVSYKVLVPSDALPDSMQLKSFKQWILFWPCIIGFAAFWALLSYIFETSIPALSREDSEFTLPLLVVAIITIIISTTRLRYPVARFVGKIFDTEPYEESSGNE